MLFLRTFVCNTQKQKFDIRKKNYISVQDLSVGSVPVVNTRWQQRPHPEGFYLSSCLEVVDYSILSIGFKFCMHSNCHSHVIRLNRCAIRRYSCLLGCIGCYSNDVSVSTLPQLGDASWRFGNVSSAYIHDGMQPC